MKINSEKVFFSPKKILVLLFFNSTGLIALIWLLILTPNDITFGGMSVVSLVNEKKIYLEKLGSFEISFRCSKKTGPMTISTFSFCNSWKANFVPSLVLWLSKGNKLTFKLLSSKIVSSNVFNKLFPISSYFPESGRIAAIFNERFLLSATKAELHKKKENQKKF